jgi:GTP-binding protein
MSTKTSRVKKFNIVSAEFITSSTSLAMCPAPDKPEFAFIGRSNVGKSSLINMLTDKPKLAKISAQPGKTQTINHFLVNQSWYLADLPGYGFAKVSKSMREKFSSFISSYLKGRESLLCLFVLLDARHGPMAQDLAFMERIGNQGIPFARVFTKADKISRLILNKNIAAHDKAMLETWESLPPTFITSAKSGSGRDEILSFVENTITLF